MPCDRIRITTVELGRINIQTMRKAIKAAGGILDRDSIVWNGVRFQLTNKGVTGNSRSVTPRFVASLKRLYAEHVVKEQFKRYGWALKSKKMVKGTEILEATRG